MCLIFNFFYLSNNIHMSTNKIFIISSGSSYLLSNISVLLSSNLNIPIQIIKNIPDGNINQSFLLKNNFATDIYFRNKITGTTQTIRDISTAISYWKIWTESFEQNLDRILIIEDTVAITSDIINESEAYVFDTEFIKKIIESGFNKKLIPISDFLGPKYNLVFKTDQITSPFYTTLTEFYDERIQIVTVGSDETEGLVRFVDSCRTYDFPYIVLGMHTVWQWDLTMGPGGGRKINLLKEYLDKFESDDNRLILFSDSYDVIINDNPQSILEKFKQFDCDLLFSAESLIWPDKNLAPKFPQNSSPYKYLNSGGFIGSIRSLKQLTTIPISDADDDQLYYQLRFLENENLKIKLDYECKIFQTLSALFSDIDIDMHKYKIINKRFGSNPSVIHGNGGVGSKLFLNSLGNYIPIKFYPDIKPETNHTITFMVNITNTENMTNIFDQNYPKDKCTYIFYSKLDIKNYPTGSNMSFKQVETDTDVRNLFIETIQTYPSDYYFMADTSHLIENPDTIQKLIGVKKHIIAPMLVLDQLKLFSNFWGAVGSNGYYARSSDYVDIVTYVKKGIWNVPYVSSSILISKKIIPAVVKELYAHNPASEDFDMYFSRILRSKYIFLHVINTESYGKILD